MIILVKKYLPIDPDSEEIFDKIKDGIILCRLVNIIKEGIIDEKILIKVIVWQNISKYKI